jgi:imidazolonepropionase-like amidohydrolase
VIRALKDKYAKQIEIIPTFLGAHDFPPELSKEEYVVELCEKMIPAVAKDKLAEYCDVFCEDGYFNYDMSKQILSAAKDHKLKVRIHRILHQYRNFDSFQRVRYFLNSKGIDRGSRTDPKNIYSCF